MKKFLVIIVMLLLISSCEKISKMNGQYKWLVETVADYGYPMEIKSGAFYDEKGNELAGIPADMYLEKQWWSGDSGSIVVGDEFRPLPSKMYIRWYSYAEDKFYEGEFNLNHHKIEDEFKKGFKCSNGKYTFSALKVAVAPAGQVFLYLTGGNILLVDAFTAKEIFVNDFKKEMGIRDDIKITRQELREENIIDMPLQTKKEIQTKIFSTDIWRNINIHYPWKYTFEVIDFNGTFNILKEKQGADFISGEQTWCVEGENYYTLPVPKAIPLELSGDFETAAGRILNIRVLPGNVNQVEPKKQSYEIRRAREQELVKIFKEFYEKIGKQEFELHLKVSSDFKTGKVYLKKGNTQQEIPNVEVQIEDLTYNEK